MMGYIFTLIGAVIGQSLLMKGMVLKIIGILVGLIFTAIGVKYTLNNMGQSKGIILCIHGGIWAVCLIFPQLVGIVIGLAIVGYLINKFMGKDEKEEEASTKENGIKKTALIMVGEFLGTTYNNSKLYDKDFKDLPGSIYINNVTYNKVSGSDSWANYQSSDGHEVKITYVSSAFNGEAETNVGHIRY